MKKRLILAVSLFLLLAGSVLKAQASQITAVIDVKKQVMTVKKNGETLYNWKVSTARKGYVTPGGTYRPQRMHKMWYSKKYNNSPMPYSIFYSGGYAIHGTKAIGRLGRPASHGCVRLATQNAKTLFDMVKKAGSDNLKIVIRH